MLHIIVYVNTYHYNMIRYYAERTTSLLLGRKPPDFGISVEEQPVRKAAVMVPMYTPACPRVSVCCPAPPRTPACRLCRPA